MAPRFGSKKAGTGPGSLGGQQKQSAPPFAAKGKASKAPAAAPFGAAKKPSAPPKAGKPAMPMFKRGGKVGKDCC